MTVWWCFVEKKNVLMKKNSPLAGTKFQIKLLRLERPLDGLSYYRTAAVVILTLKLSISFTLSRLVLCTFSLFHACFLAFGVAFCMVSLPLSLDSVGVTSVWNWRLARVGGPNGHGIATTNRQRTRKAIIDPLFKKTNKQETRCMMSVLSR